MTSNSRSAILAEHLQKLMLLPLNQNNDTSIESLLNNPSANLVNNCNAEKECVPGCDDVLN